MSHSLTTYFNRAVAIQLQEESYFFQIMMCIVQFTAHNAKAPGQRLFLQEEAHCKDRSLFNVAALLFADRWVC